MKYGIKLKGPSGNRWVQLFSEVGNGTAGPVVFEDTSSAEIYAQNHELKNYTIEVINDTESSSEGPQFIKG